MLTVTVSSGLDATGLSSTAAPRTSNPLAIIVAMASCAVVSHALARATFPILLPAIETELLSNRQQSGLLGSANFVAYLVGVAVVTVISGRVEPMRLLLGGLVAALIGFVLLAVADGLWSLAAGQALTGLGSAGIWMSAPAIATGAAPPTAVAWPWGSCRLPWASASCWRARAPTWCEPSARVGSGSDMSPISR